LIFIHKSIVNGKGNRFDLHIYLYRQQQGQPQGIAPTLNFLSAFAVYYTRELPLKET
jgi:hypothetical protein